MDYHLRIGFARIYIMFDDPKDPDVDLVRDFSDVTSIPVDKTIQRAWKKLVNYRPAEESLEWNYVMRQRLNAEYILHRARDEGFEWLLHLDDDELFWTDGESIESHLDDLAQRNLAMARYYNYEALPIGFDIANPFLEVTLFKKHYWTLVRDRVKRRQHWPESRPYFNYHTQGKSITRTSRDIIPINAHRWDSLFARARGWPVKSAIFERPVVLHFSACGYDRFLRKFEFIKPYKDMHTYVYHHIYAHTRRALNVGEEQAQHLYRQSVMMEEGEARRLLRAGVLAEIDLKQRFTGLK